MGRAMGLALICGLFDKETICRLVTVSEADFYVAAPNGVAIFLKHDAVEGLALMRVVCVDLEGDEGKATGPT